MAGDRRADVLRAGDDEARRPLRLTPAGSVLAAVTAVHLLLAGAVVADRRPTTPPPDAPRVTRPSPPAPRRVPVFGAEAEQRRRTAVATARFAAERVCADASRFRYVVRDATVDMLEAVIDARDPALPEAAGIVVKVTLRGSGALAYRVLSENGSCDA